MTPIVTIIIPCYNAERFIAQALRSILWQTVAEWECIVVDDGSTDGSVRIVKSFLEKEERIRLVTQRNQGPSVARNTGASHATGEYIQFLDADDVLLPERLSQCVNEFVLHPECDVVYSDYVLFHQGEGFIKLIPAQISDADTVKAMLFDLNVKFVVLMHTLMFRRSVVIETPFDTSFSHWSEDQDCWVRMALKNIRFFYVDEVLAVYRFAENNLTSKESELLLAKLAMVKKYSAKPELNKYSQEFLSSRLYLQQRLVMGYFMERSFSAGVRMMKSIVVQSSVSAIIKMICWGVIMLFFPKHVVVKTRAWIVTKTPLKWGAWKRTQVWPAPKYLVELLESEKQ